MGLRINGAAIAEAHTRVAQCLSRDVRLCRSLATERF